MTRMLAKAMGHYFKPTAAAATGPRDPQGKARRHAKVLASIHEIEIERLKDGGFNVWPPLSCGVDPFEGDHFAADWDAVFEAVATYAGGAVELEAATRYLTAFDSFAAMLNAGDNYRPSFYPLRDAPADNVRLIALADAYDQAQERRRDPRRCYRAPDLALTNPL